VRVLLDTHVAVWSVSSSHRIPKRIIDLVANPGNDVFISVVSLWEIALKNRSAGRDSMPFSAAVGAARFVEFGYATLDLLPGHVFRSESLPPHHRDPFDRILVGQALVERLRIVTHDPEVARYGDDVIAF